MSEQLGVSGARRWSRRRARVAPALLAFLALTGCATVARAPSGPLPKIAVLTPVDRVPVTDAGVWLDTPHGADVGTRRENTLLALRTDLVGLLAEHGAEVCEDELAIGDRPESALEMIAERGRADGVEVVILPELIAYGQVRRAWLWLLAGQGVLAGIGHGVLVAQATGDPTLGWWAGAGEFVLETVTWVGGAWLAARTVDPVVVRLWAVRSRDAALLGRWTAEGTRPLKSLLHPARAPARGERLREVAGRRFDKLAPKLLAHIRPTTKTR